jgi:hypothetical protein
VNHGHARFTPLAAQDAAGMNLAQLQAELNRLGITFQSDSDPANIAADLHLQRQYRASIYLAELQAAETDFWTNFNTPVPGGLGPAYAFAQSALRSGELLNSLALVLDYWVCPAVEGQFQVNNYTTLADYSNYFTANILNANYAANVVLFRNNYPITDNALTQIAANFRNNIKEACARAYTDRTAIQNLFIDLYPGLTLNSLKAVTSTGSDFHKGGRQVAVLTFGTFWWWGNIPWWLDLKVVYKPTDLEIDCLLVGNSAAVNAAVAPAPAFMANSLVEIFNNRAAAAPPANFEPLPSYRILPRFPTSNMAIPPAGLPIRASYGYMEYLGYHLTGIPIPFSNYYLTGESDYLIYQTDDEAQIVPRFYRQMGEWLAFATMFAITDMHMENVRVTKYQPRLIDLEISLTKVFNLDVTETTMFKTTLGVTLGGINGVTNTQAEFLRQARINNGFLEIGRVPVSKEFQNRLWAMRPAERVVAVNSFLLLQGLRNGMTVIRNGQQNGDFTAWFNRLTNTNVLVRVLPYGTSAWETIRRVVYQDAVENAPGAPLRATIVQNMQNQLNMDFPNYVAPGLPTFVTMIPMTGVPAVPGPALTDLEHFDIPAFYHRIGTTDILGSNGQVVPIAGVVTINGAPVNVGVVVGRGNYYAASPTTANVNVAQVQHVGNLAPAPFANLVQQMVTDTVGPNGLNTNVVPVVMGALIP